MKSEPKPSLDFSAKPKAAKCNFGVRFGKTYIFIGTLLLLYTPISYWRTRSFLQNAVRETAEVVDFKASPPDRGGTSSHVPTNRQDFDA